MDAELRAHIETYTDDLIRSGVSRAEAERRSRAAFGGIEAVKEECREARGLRWPDELRQDLRYAFHALRKAPGFAAAAVLSLVLGIGVNTAIFSVIDAALIRPLAYTEPGRLAAIYENRTTRGAGFGAFANANFVDLRANAPSFEDIAAHTSTGLSLTGAGEAEQLLGRLVTGNMFAVLGVPAHQGRTLIPASAASWDWSISLKKRIPLAARSCFTRAIVSAREYALLTLMIPLAAIACRLSSARANPGNDRPSAMPMAAVAQRRLRLEFKMASFSSERRGWRSSIGGAPSTRCS